MIEFSLTTLAIPLFTLLLLIEMWLIHKRRDIKGYEWRDTAISVSMGIGSQVAGLLTVAITFIIATWTHQFAFTDIGLNFSIWWWAWLLCFVVDDLSYYVFHRVAHRVRWFWAAHVNHHSSEHYNLSTALRQTWTNFIAVRFIFRMPLFLIFPPEMVYACAGINLIYQYWIHTEAIDRLPRWYEWLLNTPSHHRVHHANNAEYLDANYAGVFMIWDRMFGSFVAERREEPVRYGLVKQLDSFNIFNVAFHEWVGIVKDMWSAPWRHKLSYMFREPGWSHDGSRETTAMIKARSRAENLPEQSEK